MKKSEKKDKQKEKDLDEKRAKMEKIRKALSRNNEQDDNETISFLLKRF